MNEGEKENLISNNTNRESQPQADFGPLEILREGKKGMEVSDEVIKIWRELRGLRIEHSNLSKQLKIASRGDSAFDKNEILDKIDKNKDEQNEIKKKIQEKQDAIKRKMTGYSVKKEDEH